MDTKEQLTILSEICRQDLKIISNREKLSRLNRDSNLAKEAAVVLKETIDSLSQKKAELLKRRRALDDKLQLERGNLRKWELRAEKIKGEREYTALMSEIGSQKRTITGIETEMNEVTDELKASDEKLKVASGAHDEKTTSASLALASVKEVLDIEEQELQQKEAVRAKLLEKIPAALRMKYERIYEKRANQGIALLREGVCQACMRKLPPELFNRVCKGEVIEQCPSCQRLMVADLIQTA
ncbi:MAG TPA: C4-type zinc ribbon domain-containing protein [Myxococcota bacterium]|nr:C4-type zinc ribbon domain-containing protein [Myxococcota bacterium]